MAGKKKRLFLIDGSNNLYRSYYAIRGLTNSEGFATNAVYGFTQMLKKLLADHKPDAVAVFFDVKGKTNRHERYPEYKAERKPMPDDLSVQVPIIEEVIEAFGIPIIKREGVEADDLMASLARRAKQEGYHVTFATSDKDFFQLIEEDIDMYHTGREIILDVAEVTESFGLPPEKVTEVMAIWGDKIDNIPGIPGIGEKGAKELISEFGSLEEIYADLDAVTKKSHRTKLEKYRDDALLSLELVTIDRDMDVDLEPEALALGEPDRTKLHEIFKRLEIRSLMKEYMPDRVEEQLEVTKAEKASDLDKLASADRVAQYLWEGSDGSAEVIAFSVANDQALVVSIGDQPADVRTALANIESNHVVGHDIKSQMHALDAIGLEPPTSFDDTMIMSYVIRPGAYSHDLEELVREKLMRESVELGKSGSQKEMFVDVDRLATYAADRSEATFRLYDIFSSELEKEPKLEEIYETIERPLIPVLHRMESNGIRLDTELLGEMSARFGSRLEALESQIYTEAGEEFNINSPSQLGVILFEKLDYPIVKKTAKTKNYSTSVDVLERLAADGYPIPSLILEHRELHKLKSTYIDALPRLVDSNGRLHTRFNQAVAATGRLSSSDPNLQNIPVRSELGREIRKAFVADQGYVLLAADYSQIELRLAAHMSQDENLIEGFHRGADIHRATAARMFGLAEEDVSNDQRRAAKTINFGVLYGMSAFRVGNELGMPTGEAQKFVDAYFARAPRIRGMLDATLEDARKTGKVTTLFGRVRYIPEIHNRSWAVRSNAERMAINAPIQGTAADILKIAMIRLDERLRSEAPEARMLLTVHDEIVFEIPENDVESVDAMIHETMEGVFPMSVPLDVSSAWGPTWYEAK